MNLPSCPCGSNRDYAACCGRYHDGTPAPSAEALMRSRYSAFVQQRADYLLATWHPDTRPAALDLNDTPAPQWLGLKILAAHDTGPNTATVEFVARYRINGRGARQHEISRFQKIGERWYYLDGQV